MIDDEDTVCAVAKIMLERAGFSVLTAADGQEAIEVFRKHAQELDLVLLDVTMPRMDGEETFSEMRRIRSDIRVILSSGYNEQEATNRFGSYRFSGFIQKPYQSAALLDKVREILEPRDGSNE